LSTGLELDFIILHYFTKDKIFAHEISKEVAVDFLDEKVQLFYGILLKFFLDPKVREILSLTALLDHCKVNNLEEPAKKFPIIYEKATRLKIGGEEPKAQDLRYYIQKIKSRRTIQIARENVDRLNEILEASSPSTEEINKTIQQTVGQISSLHRVTVNDEGSLGQDIDNVINEYFQVKANPIPYRGVLTGISQFDNLTQGLHGGELTIIAGLESSGKSLMMMAMAKAAWLGTNDPYKDEPFADNGKNVLYFSLEMPRSNKGEITQSSYFNKRLLSSTSRLPLHAIRTGSLVSADEQKLIQTQDFIKRYEEFGYRFDVVDAPRGIGINDIEAKFCELNMDHPIDLVVVDYIGLMKGSDDSLPDHQQQMEVSEKLHEFARAYSVPVLTAAQLNRPSGAKSQSLDAQFFNNTRLSRSSGLSHNANNILLIVTRENEGLYSDLQIVMSKVRDGEKGGRIILTKDFGCMNFIDSPPISSTDREISTFEDLGS
jgi:replicative DNA helicase